MVEYKDANIHVHAKVTSSKFLRKRDFKCFSENFGYIDLEIVKKDHGICEYLNKEGSAVESPTELFV